MQGFNGLAILGPELEAASYPDDEGNPLSARKMVMLYNYIDHYIEKGVRREESDKRLFDKFIKLLKNKYGCYLAYCCVPELQQEWREDRHPAVFAVYSHRGVSRLIQEVRNNPPSRRPAKNPFTLLMWEDIKNLMMSDKSLQWLIWHHPDSALVSTQQGQSEGISVPRPLFPLAPRDQVQPLLFPPATQQRQSESLFQPSMFQPQQPPMFQPASQGPFEAPSGVGPRHSPQEEHNDHTRGSYSKDLLELSGTQPRFGAVGACDVIFPRPATSDPVDTNSSSGNAKHYSARMAVLEGTAMPFELQHDNDGSLTFQREQIKTVQLMIEKKRDALQEQNEVRPGITNARDTASGDIDALCDRRNQDGGETRQVRAPPQKPEPARGGIARHTGDFEMPWIPRTDTGPARGTSATRGPRPNSAWEPARTPRQDYGPTVSRQEGVTGRRGSAFEEAAVLAQRAGTPQERRTQDPRQPTRQLPPQDARHYDTQMTSGGGAQGLGINLGTQAGGTASGRVNARDTVGSEGSMFQPPMNAERTQSVGQATRGQWEDNQEEEQEDVQW